MSHGGFHDTTGGVTVATLDKKASDSRNSSAAYDESSTLIVVVLLTRLIATVTSLDIWAQSVFGISISSLTHQGVLDKLA